MARGRKTRALLGYLCLHAGERVARARICSLLWERVTDRQARSSLRQALFEMTSALGPLAGELISADTDTVRLEPRLCWIDALAVFSSEPLPQSFRSDLATMCTGELLDDLSGTTPAFDQWLLVERTRFNSRLRALYESEMEQLADASPARRAALARNVIVFDPTHEGASRMLMRALTDRGERAQAIREYERCRKALRAGLDVEPTSETRALYEAVRAFQGNGQAGPVHEGPKPSLPAGGERLRIGVQPMRVARDSPANELGVSLGREIATELARFRWFDVVAAGAAGAPSNTPVHYIVDGDVRIGGEKLRVAVRLLDVGNDHTVVWSDRFELAMNALDDLDQKMIAPIVARIDPVILFIEGKRPRTGRYGATGLVLQAIPWMYSMERQKYEAAGRLIEQAIKADPSNAKAAAWGAYWQVWHVGQGWAEDPAAAFATAQELALRAIKLDPDNAEALAIYAHICAFLNKDFDSALHYFDRSLRINPNLAFIWAISAPTYCYIGNAEEALRRLGRYRDLAPFDPYFSQHEFFYTIAYTFKGAYEKAANVGRRNVAANPKLSNAYKPLIAALGPLGRREEAAPYVEKLLALEPGFTAERFARTYPFGKPEDRERYVKGLVLAGVPNA